MSNNQEIRCRGCLNYFDTYEKYVSHDCEDDWTPEMDTNAKYFKLGVEAGKLSKAPHQDGSTPDLTTGRELLHKWFGGQTGEFSDGIGRENLLLIARTMERRRPQDAQPSQPSDVTRFEVIDHTGADPIGRIVVKYGVKVELSYQDDGRTLKVFLSDLTKDE